MPFAARFARARPLTLFFPLAYLWAWTAWVIVPRALRGHPLGWKWDAFDITLIITGSFGPTVAALAVQWLGHRNLRICRIWTGWRRMFAGLAFGFAGFFIATVAGPAFALTKVSPLALHWAALLHWSIYRVNYSSFLGGPVGEEPGWRGFALPKLQARLGPVGATAILTLFWAGWHLPLFFMPGWTSLSPLQYLLMLLGVSMLLTGAANIARFGVLVAILLHAVFNTSFLPMAALIAKLPGRSYGHWIHILPGPGRSYGNWIYVLVILVCGVAIGLVGLRGRLSSGTRAASPVSDNA